MTYKLKTDFDKTSQQANIDVLFDVFMLRYYNEHSYEEIVKNLW